ncbi:hypothetical protein CDD82_2848 [Ophiocordyceps australis]|uniref:Carboxylic ester hydrolase n=1 Tax=Ophiocordyceps australis TaxID=1399860 RepID=A0A2C5ZQ70_9HYPO|nr:hypothetical protein CDD82_2848 [Ophiocordyceps australis]
MVKLLRIATCISFPIIVLGYWRRWNAASSGNAFFTGGPAPIVDLGHAKYQGAWDNRTMTFNYLGIPYIKAERFNHGRLYEDPLEGVQSAMDYGPACPQHSLGSLFAPNDLGLGFLTGVIQSLPPFHRFIKTSEDCLFINVQRPQNQTLQNLPVLVWIHGGAFEFGSANAVFPELIAVSGTIYRGENIVRKSIHMERPIVFASFNYRLAHFGFSASRELQEAGLLNLGFEDQRLALQWIQKHIAAVCYLLSILIQLPQLWEAKTRFTKFGGDPSKVTIMGHSAGSWFVSAHLAVGTSEGQGPPLFRGAVGMSGGLVRVEGPERQQSTFDSMVRHSNMHMSKSPN